MLKSLRQSSWYIKWTQWEYWPFWVYNTPIILIWLWFGLRARNLFFFSRVNPSIPSGGMVGDSKSEILKPLPQHLRPKSLIVRSGKADVGKILSWLKESDILFPIICKPDVGERGKRVESISDETGLRKYFSNADFDVIVQEFCSLPNEAAILYYRLPNEERGTISSVCLKDMLQITGDGQSTIEELFKKYPRARFQQERIFQKGLLNPGKILRMGETINVEPIGNHCRGTKFLDGNNLIDSKLCERFDLLHNSLTGIHYARYDLKYNTWEELLNGKNICILEVNGVAGEPAHIYDPRHSIFYAYRTMFKQWTIIYKISKIQKKAGFEAIAFSKGWNIFMNFISHQKTLSK